MTKAIHLSNNPTNRRSNTCDNNVQQQQWLQQIYNNNAGLIATREQQEAE